MLHVYLFCIALSAGWALVRTGLADGSPARTGRRPPSITAPAAAFGLAGLAAQGLGASTALQLGAAVATGVLVALATSSLRRTAPAPVEEPVARVTVGIPAGGVGEIAWVTGPDRGTALARSVDGEPLPRGAEVRVVAMDAGGVLVTRTSGTLIPLRAAGR
jgi:hypothetical protein